MNQFEHEPNGALLSTTPLFASSLLALFYVLRDNFIDRRQASKPAEEPSKAKEE